MCKIICIIFNISSFSTSLLFLLITSSEKKALLYLYLYASKCICIFVSLELISCKDGTVNGGNMICLQPNVPDMEMCCSDATSRMDSVLRSKICCWLIALVVSSSGFAPASEQGSQSSEGGLQLMTNGGCGQGPRHCSLGQNYSR